MLSLAITDGHLVQRPRLHFLHCNRVICFFRVGLELAVVCNGIAGDGDDCEVFLILLKRFKRKVLSALCTYQGEVGQGCPWVEGSISNWLLSKAFPKEQFQM